MAAVFQPRNTYYTKMEHRVESVEEDMCEYSISVDYGDQLYSLK